MSMYSPSIEKLIESFEKLPSIGNKTAARLAFYILNASQEETDAKIAAINSFYERYSNLNMSFILTPTATKVLEEKLPKYAPNDDELDYINKVFLD